MGDSGTRIVPNGNGIDSKVEWGMFLRIVTFIVGIVAAVTAVIVSAAVLRVFAMSSKLDVVEARQMLVLERVLLIEKAIQGEDYVTKSNLSRWLESDARLRSIQAMIDSRGLAPDRVKSEVRQFEGGK